MSQVSWKRIHQNIYFVVFNVLYIYIHIYIYTYIYIRIYIYVYIWSFTSYQLNIKVCAKFLKYSNLVKNDITDVTRCLMSFKHVSVSTTTFMFFTPGVTNPRKSLRSPSVLSTSLRTDWYFVIFISKLLITFVVFAVGGHIFFTSGDLCQSPNLKCAAVVKCLIWTVWLRFPDGLHETNSVHFILFCLNVALTHPRCETCRGQRASDRALKQVQFFSLFFKIGRLRTCCHWSEEKPPPTSRLPP